MIFVGLTAKDIWVYDERGSRSQLRTQFLHNMLDAVVFRLQAERNHCKSQAEGCKSVVPLANNHEPDIQRLATFAWHPKPVCFANPVGLCHIYQNLLCYLQEITHALVITVACQPDKESEPAHQKGRVAAFGIAPRCGSVSFAIEESLCERTKARGLLLLCAEKSKVAMCPFQTLWQITRFPITEIKKAHASKNDYQRSDNVTGHPHLHQVKHVEFVSVLRSRCVHWNLCKARFIIPRSFSKHGGDPVGVMINFLEGAMLWACKAPSTHVKLSLSAQSRIAACELASNLSMKFHVSLDADQRAIPNIVAGANPDSLTEQLFHIRFQELQVDLQHMLVLSIDVAGQTKDQMLRQIGMGLLVCGHQLSDAAKT